MAVDDSATVVEESTTHLHILDNDFDPDGSLNPQMVEILSGPTNGSVEIIDTQAELDARGLGPNHFGHAEYTPNTGFSGVDSFTYRVQDDQGEWSNAAMMTITVDPASPPNTNQALLLDGTGGLDVEDLSLSGDFTVEAWVKFADNDAINNVDGLASSGSFGNGNDLNFYARRLRLYSSSGGGDVITANHQSESDVWTHYAVVRESGEMKIYVDGLLDVSESTNWTDPFVIDELAGGIPSGGLNGELDEFRVWTIARTQAEITLNKDIEVDSATLGLARYYQFDGGIVDATGNSAEIVPLGHNQLVDSTAPIGI